jgi:hypothetical protein
VADRFVDGQPQVGRRDDRPQRTPWASKFSPLIRVYRTGAINSTLAIVLAQIAAIIGLWLQLKGGVDISSTTPTPGPDQTVSP